jgi:hypothetical protein
MDEKEFKKIIKILYEIEKKEPRNPISTYNLKLLVDIEYNELLMDIKYLKGKDI